MRIATACLFLSLFVVLPLAAADTPAAPTQAPDARVAGFLRSLGQADSCPGASLSVRLPATADQPTPPKRLDGEVDCSQCGGGVNSPGFQCFRICSRRGLCVDQCYADASTCQLVTCICLLC